MIFFSGFSLQNERGFFTPFIKNSAYTVCGFSYGAIKALEYVQKELACGKRIDTLQLFSPAFFETQEEKFKKLQIMGYRKNKDAYLQQFLDSCFFPHAKEKIELADSNIKQLEELLHYKWSPAALKDLLHQGVEIEVYLGGKDAIIDPITAKAFFVNFASVTYIKEANHFLQIQKENEWKE